MADPKTTLRDYEDLMPADLNTKNQSADEILADGWIKERYPIIYLNRKIPWNATSAEDRTWIFLLQCWEMLDNLLKAFNQTKNKRYLRAAIKVALHWVDAHLGPRKKKEISQFAWYDVAVAVRAYRLAYILDAGKAFNLLSPTDVKKLWSALLKHQKYLSDDANIIFRNNHGFFQVAGQIAMARRFSHKSKPMAEALKQGRKRMKRLLAIQFTAEGAHREHSPIYHFVVSSTLKSIIASGLIEDRKIIKSIKTIEESLAHFILPNQRIANFGDTDYVSLACTAAEAQSRWETAQMQYVATAGSIGTLPLQSTKAFPEAGYFAVRHPSDANPKQFSESSYLAQQAGFHSRVHKQADDLTFIWSDRGSELLVDAGRYGFLGRTKPGSELWLDGFWYSDPFRIYCESTRAHNTLEFDDRNYPRTGEAVPYGSALTRWQTTNGITVIETKCQHFKNLERVRLLVFSPGQWLLVFDWFKDSSRTKHNVKQWFHLAPDLKLKIKDDSCYARIPGAKEPLRAISLLSEPTLSKLSFGKKKPKEQGWFSPAEKLIVPNYAFNYQLEEASSGAFATLFTFSKTLTADTAWSKVSRSGESGRFRWQDEDGLHELQFKRPNGARTALFTSFRTKAKRS